MPSFFSPRAPHQLSRYLQTQQGASVLDLPTSTPSVWHPTVCLQKLRRGARLPLPRLPSSALVCLSCVPVAAAVPPNLPSHLCPVCFYVTERAGFISLCVLGPFNRAGLKARHFEACATPNCKTFYETHFCASQPGHRTAT